jgi:hypothetical protein
MNFSERYGLVAVPAVLDVHAMTAELRASLWNVLHLCVWDAPGFQYGPQGQSGEIEGLAKALWFRHFKRSFSEIPEHTGMILATLEDRFFKHEWHRVYDFLETVMDIRKDKRLETGLDGTLRREHAAFRIVSGAFVQITDEKELAALQTALTDREGQFAPVAVHLHRATELFSDRTNPDYRNSIKESISAVESMAKIAVGAPKATLDEALKAMEGKIEIHKALRQGFSKLYGYTSDANGIRHAMLDEVEKGLVGAPEAKYFLLSCTSFVNYLKAKI